MKQEGADLLVILGDFDYEDNPQGWKQMHEDVLGPNFPILGVIGNHETTKWDEYKSILLTWLANAPDLSCQGDYGVNAACSFKNIFFVASGVGTMGSNHATYIQDQLSQNNSIWRICAWHKNQQAMQVGDKTDETGWSVYENCRMGGAIIATAHMHSYHRTKTLTSIETQSLDPLWPDPNTLRVGNGSSLVLVSGAGGRDIGPQVRCPPTTPPYGCNGEWASIYTSSQSATFGALFISFGVDGDPRKASGYFKNISNQVIDTFTVYSQFGQ